MRYLCNSLNLFVGLGKVTEVQLPSRPLLNWNRTRLGTRDQQPDWCSCTSASWLAGKSVVVIS